MGKNVILATLCQLKKNVIGPFRNKNGEELAISRLKMVPKKGLEPLRSRERQILSLVRLPFRHFGICADNLLRH